MSTEGNWTPYQVWMNGMMHAIECMLYDIELYGCDPEGPSPSEEHNNTVVEPITLGKRQSIESYVF